jgi:hypothetical protein
MVTAMMSLETRKPVPLPQSLRDTIESYRRRTITNDAAQEGSIGVGTL